ncbi:universal stress protein, partial [Herbaspirillum sp. HC18]
VGIEAPISETAHRFEDQLQRLVEAFDGPVAIVLNAPTSAHNLEQPLSVLVPTGGAAEARLATEMALALVRATDGDLTALHVFDPREDTELLRGRARRLGMSVLVDARRLGRRSNVRVNGMTVTSARPDVAIRRVAREGRYDLVVIG